MWEWQSPEALVSSFVHRWLETVAQIVTEERPAGLHQLRALRERITVGAPPPVLPIKRGVVQVAQSELSKVDGELRSGKRVAGGSGDAALVARITQLDAEYTQLRRLLPAKARALKLVPLPLPSSSKQALTASPMGRLQIDPALESLELRQGDLGLWEETAEELLKAGGDLGPIRSDSITGKP